MRQCEGFAYKQVIEDLESDTENLFACECGKMDAFNTNCDCISCRQFRLSPFTCPRCGRPVIVKYKLDSLDEDEAIKLQEKIARILVSAKTGSRTIGRVCSMIADAIRAYDGRVEPYD